MVALTIARDNGSEVRRESRKRYVSALERAGADVLVLSPIDSPPERFDALCLSGGEDIEAWRYGEEDTRPEPRTPCDPDRDALELALAQAALERDLPVLGICRGFQVLNVACGGRLLQHHEGHEAPSHSGVNTHDVSAEPGSALSRLYGADAFRVNSRHHQAVDDATLAPGLRPAVRHGGLIEAFESVGHRHVVGVQWHPERVADGLDHPERIFESFVRAASAIPAR